MNIKDRFKKITNFFVSKIEDKPEEQVTQVIFNDSMLQITIGQWLELLPNMVKSYIGDNGTTYTSLNAEELLKRKKVNKNELEEIDKTFGRLLMSIGIDSDEICALDDFNEEDLSFSCYFFKNADEAKMSIRFGSFLDCGSELIIDYRGKRSTYDYDYSAEEKEATISLSNYFMKLDDNGKMFNYYNSPYRYYGDVYDNENRLEVEIEYPESIEGKEQNPYLDQVMLERILSSCSFPIQIDELCRKICEVSFEDIRAYPNIKIRIKKKNEEQEDTLISYVEFENGEFVKYIVTVNGKTIEIDNFDNWSYSSLGFKASKNSDNKVTYGFEQIPQEELATIHTPIEYIEQASEEVEEVKKLALSLFI